MKKEYIIIGAIVTIIILAIIFKDSILKVANGETSIKGLVSDCKKKRITFKFADYPQMYEGVNVGEPISFSDAKLKSITYEKVVEYFKMLNDVGVVNQYEPRKDETFSFVFDAQYLSELESQLKSRQTQLTYEINCV